MISNNIDLGQIINVSMIGIIGWFIRRELASLNARLDKHDNLIFELSKLAAKLEGVVRGRLHR